MILCAIVCMENITVAQLCMLILKTGRKQSGLKLFALSLRLTYTYKSIDSYRRDVKWHIFVGLR